jgi:hypothetical protein
MADHAKESGHWYRKDGTPAYTIIGKNGKERNVTLRDARKEKLLPGVTTPIRCAAAPGLEIWKQQNVLMSALTTDRLPGESEQDYIERIIKDANDQSAKARERGTYIHGVVQAGFEGKYVEDFDRIYYESAKNEIEKHCGVRPWDCEVPFAADRYGGKVDLQNSEYVIDIKTTEKPVDELKTWDEHAWQLSAYDFPRRNRKCGILYINVLTAESRLIWIEKEAIEKGWKCFSALLDFFYAKTGLIIEEV